MEQSPQQLLVAKVEKKQADTTHQGDESSVAALLLCELSKAGSKTQQTHPGVVGKLQEHGSQSSAVQRVTRASLDEQAAVTLNKSTMTVHSRKRKASKAKQPPPVRTLRLDTPDLQYKHYTKIMDRHHGARCSVPRCRATTCTRPVFECDECGKRSHAHDNNMLTHQASHFDQYKVEWCEVCDKRFNSKSNLRNHRKRCVDHKIRLAALQATGVEKHVAVKRVKSADSRWRAEELTPRLSASVVSTLKSSVALATLRPALALPGLPRGPLSRSPLWDAYPLPSKASNSASMVPALRGQAPAT